VRAVLLGVYCLMMASCYETPPSTDTRQAVAQEALHAEADRQVGMPGITNFTELKIVRKLYELRDQNVATFSYVMDMQGRLWHVCDSIGYGLPYGVQFTNPEADHWTGNGTGYRQRGWVRLPQPEPNGLFMPPTAEGTWIICASEKQKGDIEPIYVEPRVVVSPFKLQAVGDWQIK
jgi:hypothetical protein